MTSEERRAWLDGLRPGDEVALELTRPGRVARVRRFVHKRSTVANVYLSTKPGAPALEVVSRATGCKKKLAHHVPDELVPVTDAVRLEWVRSGALRAIANTRWDGLDTVFLVEVERLLKRGAEAPVVPVGDGAVKGGT